MSLAGGTSVKLESGVVSTESRLAVMDVELAALEGKLALLTAQRHLSAIRCESFIHMLESSFPSSEPQLQQSQPLAAAPQQQPGRDAAVPRAAQPSRRQEASVLPRRSDDDDGCRDGGALPRRHRSFSSIHPVRPVPRHHRQTDKPRPDVAGCGSPDGGNTWREDLRFYDCNAPVSRRASSRRAAGDGPIIRSFTGPPATGGEVTRPFGRTRSAYEWLPRHASQPAEGDGRPSLLSPLSSPMRDDDGFRFDCARQFVGERDGLTAVDGAGRDAMRRLLGDEEAGLGGGSIGSSGRARVPRVCSAERSFRQGVSATSLLGRERAEYDGAGEEAVRRINVMKRGAWI